LSRITRPLPVWVIEPRLTRVASLPLMVTATVPPPTVSEPVTVPVRVWPLPLTAGRSFAPV
jgi:hypothetical protein